MPTGKLCPKCNYFFAVKVRSGFMLPTDPPQYKLQWWCYCGYREDAGVEKATFTNYKHAEWERMNKGRLND